ncbi:conjugal transfer protein TraA [Enterococcus faecalis]|uniref:conjugal transfer protein TraA n=1 Tax=Enterococcus faecalis TaxID=1351 RepID=UPI001CD6ECAA|nr:conjugal transfer protein TraA [Enterococcus faecalis]MCM6895423.1 conjugal transfer protein TraA [Enterococcus faecalis]
MYLNELMKLCRKEFGENQEVFYKDIFSRRSASSFEIHNQHALQIKDIALLSDRSGLSFHELINYCKEDFASDFDKDLDYFRTTLDNYAKTQDIELKKNLEELYSKVVSLHFTSLKYMNLYFMMKLILSDKIDKISKIDYPDLLDVKKIFQNFSKFTLFHYKILANISSEFSFSELKPLYDELFPISENSTSELKEIAALCLNNILAGSFLEKRYEDILPILNIYNELLTHFPSYKYKINYIHNKNLYLYVTTKNLKYLNKVVSYIDLLEDIEGVEIAEQVRTSLEHLLSQEGDEKGKNFIGIVNEHGHIQTYEKSNYKKFFQEKRSD